MTKKIAIVLAEGFEETEAVVPADILRRLGFDLVLVSLHGKGVPGAHGIIIEADCTIADLKAADLSAVILPGGMPGSVNLRDDERLLALVRDVYNNGGIAAAICAAPIALHAAGILAGKTVTGYPFPLLEETLSDANYTGNRTEIDANIITGKGPGVAFEFSVKIAEALGKKAETEHLKNIMFIKK